MLRVPEHQVAGHSVLDGKLGPLIDDSGRFYKPFQSSGRGDAELSFYTSLTSTIPLPIRKLFASFHGTTTLQFPTATSPHLPYIIIDDLFAPLEPPVSVIDLKIGTQTWPPHSSDPYLMKCLNKDKESTSVYIGFRISGVRVVQSGGEIWLPDRAVVSKYDVDDARRVLRQFVSRDVAKLDCGRAVEVYGCVLRKLVQLKEWFEVQKMFHFYSTSVLVGYGSGRGEGNVRVGLVDFAHAIDGKGAINHNFLGGLCSLIMFVREILSEAGGYGDANGSGVVKKLSDENGVGRG